MHWVVTGNRKKAADYLLSMQQRRASSTVTVERELESILDDFPVQHKEDLIDYAEQHRSAFLDKAILFSETSGTTGRPLQTPRNDVDITWNTKNQAFAYQRLIAAGTDRVAIIHPGMLSPFVEATTFALRQLGIGYVKVFPIQGICDYARIMDVLERYAITTLMTTPSLALKILYEAVRLDALGRLKVRNLLLTGELISAACVSNFKRILGQESRIHAFVYGASETASLMYGVGDGYYQAFVDDFVFEIVDGTVCPMADGTYTVTGSLHVTWLKGGLLPIRRYDTGDLFEITVRQGHACLFKPLGRASQLGEQAHIAQRLEAIVYDSNVPLFNYRATVAMAERSCRLKLVTACEELDLQRLRTALLDVLPSFTLDLVVNDPIDDFLAFTAKPKRQRFTYRAH